MKSGVAQLAERLTVNQIVEGSSPSPRASKKRYIYRDSNRQFVCTKFKLIENDFTTLYARGRVNKKGQWHGHVKFYSSNNKLICSEFFLNGKLCGIAQDFYENGRIEQQEEFWNGSRNGMRKEFDINGKIWLCMCYENDVGVGWMNDRSEIWLVKEDADISKEGEDRIALLGYSKIYCD